MRSKQPKSTLGDRVPRLIAATTVAALLATALLTGCSEPAERLSADSGRLSTEPTAAVESSAADAPDVSLTDTPTPLALSPVPEPTKGDATSKAPGSLGPSGAQVPKQAAFDVAAAMRHVRVLANTIGVRPAGSTTERQAAEYIASQLRSLGYQPELREFPLPAGSVSQNVVVVLPGSSERRLILGAHYDTKRPSPGANDNGTGVGVLLELARELRDRKLAPTIEFVFFGSEETVDADPNHHHYGSRFHVAGMSPAARDAAAGMLSIDMIGYGPELRVRTMNRGPQSLRRDLLAFASSKGLRASYLKDPGKYGWSDHEPFELAGIPAAWIEWRDDPLYHTARDTPAHVSTKKVQAVGQLVLDYVRGLNVQSLERLRDE